MGYKSAIAELYSLTNDKSINNSKNHKLLSQLIIILLEATIATFNAIY